MTRFKFVLRFAVGAGLLSIGAFGAVGCVGSYDDEEVEITGQAIEPLTNALKPLDYEGSCQYLKSCSGPSQPPYVGINWACKTLRTDWQTGACSNSDRWVAVPSGYKDELCATKIKICKGALCTLAEVRDVSNASLWEASPAVMADLGLSYADGAGSYPNCTNGTGHSDATTISSGTWSAVSSVNVPAYGAVFVYFSPNKAGNHVLDYAIASAQSGYLKVQAYWTSNASPGWHYFPATDATVQAKRLPLYSGSADVKYAFQIQDYSGSGRTFVYRTLTGL